MTFVIIIIIAVAILAYFSFSGGKQAEIADLSPQITDTKNEASTVGATLKDKYIADGGKRRGHSAAYLAVFDCDDGEEREFFINRAIFEEISLGEHDTLIYSGSVFLGFGEHGGTEIADSLDGDSDSDFSYDDFDESIDIEQTPDAHGEGLSGEDLEFFKQFRNRVKLPMKMETVEDETDSISKYLGWHILQKTTLYPFLKQESEVRDMFERTYRDAVSDMLGFDKDSRKGFAADSVFVNKNEIRAAITVEECPPLKSKVTAEFGINE